MKYFNVMAVIFSCCIGLSSCEKQPCSCTPPPDGPIPTIEVIIMNEDSSSLKTHPNYHPDSIYLFAYSGNKLYKEENGMSSHNLHLDTSDTHIKLRHPGNYGSHQSGSIYFKTLNNDIDTIKIYPKNGNDIDYVIKYNYHNFEYEGDSTKVFYVIKSI